MPRRVAGPDKLPRRFTSHLNANGYAFRMHWRALEDLMGRFTNGIIRELAADVCAAHVAKVTSTAAWESAVQQRRTKKGKPPSLRQLERFARRAALDGQTYQSLFMKLQDLAGHTERPKNAHARMVQKYSGGGGASA